MPEPLKPGSHLVQLQMTVRNMLPEAMSEIHRDRGNFALAEKYATEAADSHRLALDLVRDVALPGVPRVGEEVVANPNWDAVRVIRVEWMLDPETDDEAHVTVYLEDLDEDEVGAEHRATLLLLESGWRPTLEL